MEIEQVVWSRAVHITLVSFQKPDIVPRGEPGDNHHLGGNGVDPVGEDPKMTLFPPALDLSGTLTDQADEFFLAVSASPERDDRGADDGSEIVASEREKLSGAGLK